MITIHLITVLVHDHHSPDQQKPGMITIHLITVLVHDRHSPDQQKLGMITVRLITGYTAFTHLITGKHSTTGGNLSSP